MPEDRRADDARIEDIQTSVHRIESEVRTEVKNLTGRVDRLEVHVNHHREDITDLRQEMRQTREAVERLEDRFVSHDQRETEDRATLLTRALWASWGAWGALGSVLVAVLMHFALRGGTPT